MSPEFRIVAWETWRKHLELAAQHMNELERQLEADGWRYNHLTRQWQKEEEHAHG